MCSFSPDVGAHGVTSESESESESEFHLFETHIYIQKKYLNMISDCKMWVGRALLRPVWSLSQHRDECKGGGAVFDAAELSFTMHCCSPHPGHDKRLQHLGQYWGESDGA